MDKRWLGGGSALVALLIALAWWLGWFNSEDPLIAQTRVAIEQRMAMFEQLMPLIVPMFMRQFENRYDTFMAMTPEQQRTEIDKEIDKYQKRAAAGQTVGQNGGGDGGGGRPQMDPAKAAAFQKKMLAWTTPEQRAKFQNGMMLFSNRMKERGLTPPQMPGGGFF
jgi:hypothetical protein